jgi:serine phosphatase RsbU (regulator of sigma subunit)/DNA-binding response OmpR family regulator/anti-sigma regulatory factor (Ser/Thr protein kinase)
LATRSDEFASIGSGDGLRREIVLVEDSPDYARAVEAMLAYASPAETFEVRHCTTLSAAADLLSLGDAACILLDLNLPDATGVDGVRALHAAAPDVPIVVLSGVDDEDVALEAMHAGAQDYLVKQRADADLITRAVRYAMERARNELQRIELLREQTARAEAEAIASTLTRLARLTEAALTNLTLDELLDELLEHVSDMLEAETAAILLLDEERQVLQVEAAKGLEGEVESNVQIPVGHGFAGRIAAERRSVVIDDVSQAEIVTPIVRERVASLVGVPLLADGRVIGAMHVGTLSPRKFTAEDTIILQLAADRAARGIERAQRFQQEHQTAVTLQRALLPDRLPHLPGLALAARYLPGAAGSEVGGDWYDVIPLSDGRVGIAMGDVVGRGISAASLMGQLRNALRAYAVEGYSPAALLERLDRLVQTLSPGRMATLLYLVLAADGRSAALASAGHLPVLVVPEEGCARLLSAPRGVPLGVLPYATYEEAVAEIEPGATLVTYTDGLVEQRGVSIEIQLEKLRAVASGVGHGPNELCSHLLREMLPEGAGNDDVALLALTTAPAATDRLALTLPAVPEALITARRALRNWLGELGAGPQAVYDLTLAAGEACTNAIEHAYAPGDASFDIEAQHEDDAVRVVVRDYGQWRPARGQNRGRGLRLMEALMEEVVITRAQNGTIVEMRRALADGNGSAGA